MQALKADPAETAILSSSLLNTLLSLDIGACVAVIGLDRSSVWLARATGAEVSILGLSPAERAAAMDMDADHYFSLSDPMTFRALEGAFDLIIGAEGLSGRSVYRQLLKNGGIWVTPEG